jgi:formiminotetrahydrofolate cyclodeaminase
MDRPDYSTVASKMRTSRDHAGLLIDKLMSLAKRDAEAYSLVIDTRRRCVDSSSSMAPRETAMQDSLLVAAQIPLDVCRAAEEVVRLCEVVATCGNVNAITDSGTAAMLASTACAAAAYNVRVNVRALPEPADGVPLAVEATALTRSSAEISARVAILVEAAL